MKPVQSVVRALDFLFLLAESDQPLNASAAAVRLRLPRPTVYRLAETLGDLGLVARVDAGFITTPKLLLLASGSRSTLQLQDVAHPYLQSLVSATGETAGLHVLKGDLRRCIDEVEGHHGIRWSRGVGFTAPAWSGAVGHVLLAGMTNEQLQPFFDRIEFEQLASGSIRSLRVLKRRIVEARERGWSASHSETVQGAAAIAASVQEQSRTVAAINLYAPADREEALHGWIPVLIETAKKLSDEWTHFATVLGHESSSTQ